ncbi:anaerobic DMSO reductase DmsABC, chain B, iron-sulfur subunit [Campylobacter blaseri]|uniref:Dimethylsulfoxide reductase, chain B n=1 Tax=Campylobacter blaseri TaxID=2042961 RepID=A0A2P8R3A2_9BACT|nr:DMSO/selenate family reductase complex B subunit [Campylobacter blaseri]PSM52981.1 dimethylsulfoxide reductase, chain B [Campylobacter blaseri]PSM54448.1 dimethylsulfoxide reductase, chain B [Campylobacter blaseri]QKF85308.1 anaerobic DMSO reductase DmsABC, chain B, iron-sulfur subunit [Campylobacter blaseri]
MKKSDQFGFMINQSRCIGCRTCQMACKDYQDSPIGVNFRRVYEYEGGDFTVDENNVIHSQSVYAYYTTISCNHCMDPACLKACPTGAMMKTRYGIVMVNDKRCVGCQACAMACPYGSPQFNKHTGHMNKCDGCIDRLDEGKDPVCVSSCPFRALDYGDINELRDKYKTSLASCSPLPSETATLPNLAIVPEKNTKPSYEKSGKMHLPHKYQGVEDDIL